MNVILVNIEPHGFFCVAADVASAVEALMEDGWLDEHFVIGWNEIADTACTIKDELGANWANIISEFSVELFNDFFEGAFFLDVQNVYKKGE